MRRTAALATGAPDRPRTDPRRPRPARLLRRDARGRTLDEARDTGFPDFAHPPAETNATVGPGEATYSTRKIAMERTMRGAGVPVAILRPAAIYGIGALHPREWWFVKRALDGRRRVPLAFDGHSVFHTSSASASRRSHASAFSAASPARSTSPTPGR